MTRGKAGHYWPRAVFSPFAVLLTSGDTYSVPAGASSVAAWAVGAGSAGSYQDVSANAAGAVAHKTWTVQGGETISMSIPGSNSVSSTTVTLNGQTIRARSGSGSPWWGPEVTDYDDNLGATWLQESNADVLVWGGRMVTAGACGSDFSVRGGAVGGNDLSPVLECPAGICPSGRRYVMRDVASLKSALVLAGAKTIDTCSDPQAFGSGSIDSEFYGYVGPGVGGGGGSSGAVGLYFL